jgi:hypothetical protein
MRKRKKTRMEEKGTGFGVPSIRETRDRIDLWMGFRV